MPSSSDRSIEQSATSLQSPTTLNLSVNAIALSGQNTAQVGDAPIPDEAKAASRAQGTAFERITPSRPTNVPIIISCAPAPHADSICFSMIPLSPSIMSELLHLYKILRFVMYIMCSSVGTTH